MTNYFWLIAATVVLAVGGGATWYATRPSGTSTADGLTYKVQRGPFVHDVVERGEVESSSNIEIRSEVKTRNASGIAILEVVPEGQNVQAGDVLLKLDSSALELERTQQQIVCNNTQAATIQSKNTFESAQIAQQEYLQGTYLQDEQLILSEVFVAEENLRRAQLSMRSSERLAASGLVTPLQLDADRFASDKSDKELATAKTKLRVLQDFTKAKMLKQFDSDIKSAEAKYKADQGVYELELAKLADLEEQIRKCVIKAPAAGQVKYANIITSGRAGSNSEFVVEPGALVRERQPIIRLPDASLMQVRAKINESRVSRVRAGQNATVFLDAFPDVQLDAEVVKVNEYPEPSSGFTTTVKEYATLVRIKNPPEGLRPGLTAMARINVERQDDAVQVPVQAVHERGGQTFVFVKHEDSWEPREVQLGSNNDKFVIVKKGVEENELVSVNPRKVLEKVALPELPPGSQIAKNDSKGGKGDKKGSQVADTKPGDRKPAEGNGPGPAPGNGPPGGERKGPGGAGGGPGGNPNATPGQIAAGMMSRMDKDGDGKISLDEIPEDRRERMVAADKNNDGFIDLAELTASVRARRASGGGGPGGPGGSGGFGPGGPPPGAGQ